MLSADRADFFERFMAFRLCYPKPPEPNLFETIAEAYFSALKQFDRDVVFRAMSRGLSQNPTFFPAAGELMDLCKLIAREKDKHQVISGVDRGRKALPDLRQLPFDNPFMQLAEKWRRESQELGLQPDEYTPQEIGLKRFKELFALLDKHPIGNGGR